MQTFRGIATIAAASRDVYFDITMPQVQNYGYKLQHLAVQTLGNDTANAALGVCVSNKAVPRTTLTIAADGIPPDVLAMVNMNIGPAGTLVFDERTLVSPAGQLDPAGYIAEEPLCLYSVRLLAYAQSAAIAAGKTVYLAWLMSFDSVKLSPAQQEAIYKSAYT